MRSGNAPTRFAVNFRPMSVKTVYICTDMEGIAGIDDWNQCYDPDDDSPAYQSGLKHLAADVHATVEGCLQAGVKDIRVLDGHGRNQHRGLLRAGLHPAAKLAGLDAGPPVRLRELDEEVDAALMVGQHAMAGTLNGFIDHTQDPKRICRYLVNGVEHGEMSQFALYAGSFDVPLVHVSGDEALCSEAARFYPSVQATPTKQGTGWNSCRLYPVHTVRAQITADVASALLRPKPSPSKAALPLEITVEFAWSALADELAAIPGVCRDHARTVSWKIEDPKDIYTWPSSSWHPLQ